MRKKEYTNNLFNKEGIFMSAKDVYNNIRLLNIKRAKLRQKEAELELQHKNNSDPKEIHQTMKDISKLKKEIKNLN